MSLRKILLTVLLVLNVVVLLGQIWPDGAPPFARSVNLAFLAANLAFLSASWALTKSPKKKR